MKAGNRHHATAVTVPLFYFAFCGTLLGLCFPSLAQQKEKARIGYLALRTAPSGADKAFFEGLRELGYIEHRNIIIDYRWAAGNVDQLSSLAKELVQLRVDIIVASSTPATQAAKNATTAIPIVMTGSADPVGTGLIASLAHPGGNITGMSAILPELAGKRLELLRDLLPKLSRVAFLVEGTRNLFRTAHHQRLNFHSEFARSLLCFFQKERVCRISPVK